MTRRIVQPLIVGAILVAVCVALRLILPGLLSQEAGDAVAFFTVLVAILSGYICFISFVARLLSGRVPERLFVLLERLFIAGIILGIVGMFQPWVPVFYPAGFILMFAATWIFTLWGYVIPKSAHGSE